MFCRPRGGDEFVEYPRIKPREKLAWGALWVLIIGRSAWFVADRHSRWKPYSGTLGLEVRCTLVLADFVSALYPAAVDKIS